MAYSTSVPPEKLVSNLDNTFAIWCYLSADASTVVDAAGYFSNGYSLGMRTGHVVFVVDNDASPKVVTMHFVNAASSDSDVDLTDATTITTTDSD